MKDRKRYFVRVIEDDGRFSTVFHRGRCEWTKRTAKRHADYMWTHHGLMAYVVEA